jgi:hypothetical protein
VSRRLTDTHLYAVSFSKEGSLNARVGRAIKPTSRAVRKDCRNHLGTFLCWPVLCLETPLTSNSSVMEDLWGPVSPLVEGRRDLVAVFS